MRFETKLVLTAKEKAQARKTLKTVRKLLGPKGQHWIKEEERDSDGNFCFIGALDEADGPGMTAAKAAVALSLPDAHRTDIEAIINDPADAADNSVPYFNDDPQTKFKNVRGVLTRAEKLLK